LIRAAGSENRASRDIPGCLGSGIGAEMAILDGGQKVRAPVAFQALKEVGT